MTQQGATTITRRWVVDGPLHLAVCQHDGHTDVSPRTADCRRWTAVMLAQQIQNQERKGNVWMGTI